MTHVQNHKRDGYFIQQYGKKKSPGRLWNFPGQTFRWSGFIICIWFISKGKKCIDCIDWQYYNTKSSFLHINALVSHKTVNIYTIKRTENILKPNVEFLHCTFKNNITKTLLLELFPTYSQTQAATCKVCSERMFTSFRRWYSTL